ncbi:hypothetical protein TWF730_004553 [Orbilia blumenaviensis]|uniref:Uncharacterized protein n=1 Tax=Orbilia blumenaviensis TaxID=1796055 RepID=A0AAV9U142_9PEZI
MAPAPPFLPTPRVFWLIEPGNGLIVPFVDYTKGWTNFWAAKPVTHLLYKTHPFYRISGYYPEDGESHFGVNPLEVPARDLWRSCVKGCVDTYAYKLNINGSIAKEIIDELSAPQQFEHLAVSFGMDFVMAVEEGTSFSTSGEFRARSFLRLIGATMEQYGEHGARLLILNIVKDPVRVLVDERLREEVFRPVPVDRRLGPDWSKMGDVEEGDPIGYHPNPKTKVPILDPRGFAISIDRLAGVALQQIQDAQLSGPLIMEILGNPSQNTEASNGGNSESSTNFMDIDTGNAGEIPLEQPGQSRQVENSSQQPEQTEQPGQYQEPGQHQQPEALEQEEPQQAESSLRTLEEKQQRLALLLALAYPEGYYLGGPFVNDEPTTVFGNEPSDSASTLIPYDHSRNWPLVNRYFTPSFGNQPMRRQPYRPVYWGATVGGTPVEATGRVESRRTRRATADLTEAPVTASPTQAPVINSTMQAPAITSPTQPPVITSPTQASAGTLPARVTVQVSTEPLGPRGEVGSSGFVFPAQLSDETI